MDEESFKPAWGHFPLADFLRRPVKLCRSMPANWLGLRLALAIRHRYKRRCAGAFDIEALGVRLRLHPEDNFCENRLLFMPQFYDPEEFAFLAEVLKPMSCFVDVGANIGIYTLVVANRLAAEGRVLAIEPDPETFNRLQTNLKLNRHDRVVLRQVAVGAKPGVLQLHRHATNRGQNELREERAEGSESIKVVQLAVLLAETGCTSPDVLKIDIEGMEEIVLGAYFAEASADLPRHIIIEEHAGHARPALRALLTGAGYQRIIRTRTNGIWRRGAA